jgi:DNA-binding response OmpR family regulator
LKGAGYQVTSIASVAEAQTLIDQPAGAPCFTLYILDYLLEDGAGTTLCQQIRAMDATVPIVFVSGAVREEDKQRAKDAGATEFVEKPFESALFLETLAKLSR